MRRSAALVTATLLMLGVASSAAQASPYTLKRSVENMLMSPLDVVMSPIAAGKNVYVGLRDIDDSTAVRIFYPIPGFAWNTMVQAGAGVLRGVTGVIELLPGIGLFFFEPDLQTLFAPAEDNDALVWWENGYFDVKFGVNYTMSPL